MPSTVAAGLCALAALTFWTAVGWPVMRRLLSTTLAWPFAALAGWAIHSVVALPIFFVVPFTAPSIGIVALLVLAIARWIGRPSARDAGRPTHDDRDPRVPSWAWGAALLLAALCAAAIVPKHVGDAVILSDQIFDHAKVSMVNDMARLGVPPGNPYFADDGGPGRLSYYYLLHFSAAELVRLLRVSGWEADIAMTFYAALTSLAAMMALAVRLSGRASAAYWVVALAASFSIRYVFLAVFGQRFDGWVEGPGGFGGWLFQSSWVPQHLASTTCVLLAVALMQVVAEQRSVLAIGTLALVLAAAFESSTWVGGVVLALVALLVVPWLLLRAARDVRGRVFVALLVAGVGAASIASPLLVDQFASSTARQTHAPVVVHVMEVMGDAIPAALRHALDLPAFWLVLLPIEFCAMYIPGMIGLVRAFDRHGFPTSRRTVMQPYALAAFAALSAAWLLASTFAVNNDLGWRAGLLAAVLLIVFAATVIASWWAGRKRIAVAFAAVLIALGLPETVMHVQRNLAGHFRPAGRDFALMPALWEHVRDRSTPTERIASNPQSMETMTPWAVNIGWSLLSQRRSCYAGWELTQVFTAVPHDRLRAIDAQFVRVFEGKAQPGDVEALATRYDCALAVVTPQDGAWRDDPFAHSGVYRLVDEREDRWRLYRRANTKDVDAPH